MSDLTPNSWFDTPPGEDGTIVGRDEIRHWLTLLAASTDRMHTWAFGTSTEGNPMDAVIIGDGIGGNRFEDIARRRSQAASELMTGSIVNSWSKPIVLVTSGIHATEIGGPQSIPDLIHWLVTSDDQDATSIRDQVLTIIVPTLNPDGMDMVKRWIDRTRGTENAGSLPPLLYHRFAGHDNNRDWLFRNLVETRMVIDRIHNSWLPHVTLDQHQMNQRGPRFALPPYADPWEPHIHPSIIAASSSLGLSMASDLTMRGMAGVMTGQDFDAWEPSRAIQHYRGGVRILAEAASANLAQSTTVTTEQLTGSPLPQQMTPTGSSPLPWAGGTWRLRDIVDYHLEAAKSLLRHVSRDPERWTSLQREALAPSPSPRVTFRIPFDRPAVDRAANRLLADLLEKAGSATSPGTDGMSATIGTEQPMAPLVRAVLQPKPYPNHLGGMPYDVTTHHLPLYMGAVVDATARRPGLPHQDTSITEDALYLAIDARCHAAPEIIEASLRSPAPSVWRTSAREIVGDTLIESGTWIVDRRSLARPDLADSLAYAGTSELPECITTVTRRDIVLMGVGDAPTADHGWIRLWLQERTIPFLETDLVNTGSLSGIDGSTTILIADTPRQQLCDDAIGTLRELISAGANVIAFGAAGRALAEALEPAVSTTEMVSGGKVQAPGALVRLRPDRGFPMGMGLDRAIPAMFQRDGVFRIEGQPACVDVLATYAARDTLISGWMSDVGELRDSPAVLRIQHGDGNLFAFAFRPLFRGQMLVTSPLVHNLLYSEPEPKPCPHFDLEKTRASIRNDRTS